MIIGILQARVSSSRLPGKVLKPILGKPMLARQLERLQRSTQIDKLIVATSTESSDDPIAALCAAEKITCFRGNLNNVLDRYYQASQLFAADHIVRLTGDCPLIDPVIVDEVIQYHLTENNDYTSNALEPTYPDGLDVEVLRLSCLAEAWRNAVLPSHHEHVTPYIYSQPTKYKLGVVKNNVNLSHLRWTVDNQADFDLVTKIYEGLFRDNLAFGMNDILQHIMQHPTLQTINTICQRNEGFEKSLQTDQLFLRDKQMNTTKNRYQQSQALLKRALQVIPLGAQTFSKSITQFPADVSPHFLERGQGSHVWDVDGNEYIDFINSLAAINLGYNDPDVNQAVLKQFELGVSFSLSHRIESLLAEKIIEMVPCAEMVRFGKNGSDVTAGAVRLARAFTGREHVAVCGYHGWQDWYIGSTTRNLGVPKSIQALTHPFVYNDLQSLQKLFDQYPDQIAAVIMEPMNVSFPKAGFLEGVRELATKNKAVLIFDEVVTGFRFANGGAQEYFGVTPDLATFGKGLANGYPLSALVGRKDIMTLVEEIFFSFTFGGETLSIAAGLATLNKLQHDSVIAKVTSLGEKLIDGVKDIIQRHQLNHLFEIVGHPVWSFLLMKGVDPYSQEEIKTLWMQEVLSHGILAYGTHNLSYAHSMQDIEKLFSVYEIVLPLIADVVAKKTLHQHLRTEPLRALFKVR